VHRGEVRWILEADIQSFFDSVDRPTLGEMLRVRVADGALRRHAGDSGKLVVPRWLAISLGVA